MADEANEGWSGAVRGPIRGYRKPGSDSVPGTAGQGGSRSYWLGFHESKTSLFSIRISPFAVGPRPSPAWRRAGDGGADGRGRGASTRCGTGLGRGPVSRPAPFTTPNYTSVHESILPCLAGLFVCWGLGARPCLAGQAARVTTGLVSTSQYFPVLDSYFSVRGGPAAISGLETSRRRWRGRPWEGSQHPLWDRYRPGPASRPAPFTTPNYPSLHESILTCLSFRIYSF